MKKFFLIIIIIGTISGIFFVFHSEIFKIYSEFFTNLPEIEKNIGDIAKKVQKQINVPPPLKAGDEDPEAFLTKSGVIQLTNTERKKNGLALLQENLKLNASAQTKLNDMFKTQYFEHTSPSGIGVSDLAKNEGYEFIIIGENLAMGNFKDNQTLVQGWMDSPGHRANILNPQYKEIGVAVGKGEFQGHATWISVQHFGTPLSVCPEPASSLKQKIDFNGINLDSMKQELNYLQTGLENTMPGTSNYQKLVREYNSLVSQYNALAEKTKSLVNQYNQQVQGFNTCVSGLK